MQLCEAKGSTSLKFVVAFGTVSEMVSILAHIIDYYQSYVR